jgi:rubrerythrin
MEEKLIEILTDALKGENIAKRKYKLFSEQARKENLPMIAYIFKTVAYAENIHIGMHKNVMEKLELNPSSIEAQIKINEEELREQVNRTKVNLLNSRVNETFEFLDKYRNFALLAKKYGVNLLQIHFSNIKKAERSHAVLFQDYLYLLNENVTIESKKLYVCQKCGTVKETIPAEKCPSCQNPSSFYIRIKI